jgi:hypothetical protein
MISEPTVDNEKLIKARGLCTTRPHQKRKDRVDGSTKHFPSGDASNRGQCTDKPHNETRDGSDATIAQFCSGDALDSCEVFVGDTPNHKNCEKEGEDRNGHLTWAVETSDGSSDPPLDHVLEFELNNSEKAMDGNKLVSNSVDFTDLSSVRSSYSASSKYVEGLEQVGLSVNGEKSEPVKADKG